MTVAELKAELAKYPDNMEVVFDGFDNEIECYNFINDSHIGKDNKVHLSE